MGIAPTTRIMNAIKDGHAIPEDWADGTIVYIYKHKGGPGECVNYRLICLTQIIYEIWSGLIARKLTKVTHIITKNNHSPE